MTVVTSTQQKVASTEIPCDTLHPPEKEKKIEQTIYKILVTEGN
jgi:hypothetical protein